MRRRDFITLLGGAAATWPMAARGQRAEKPVVGFLHSASPAPYANLVAAFLQGLKETGYIEGQNVTIEYRWAHDKYDQLPVLANDLVRRRVAVIATPGGGQVALSAKAATSTIPIVFSMGGDPVQAGLVPSLNRPGGNVTGASYMNSELGAKRLGLLQEFLPRASRFAVLVNPRGPAAEAEIAELRTAASAIGWQIEVLTASSNQEIDTAFATLLQKRAAALLVTPHPLFGNRRPQILTLAARHAVPVIFPTREWVELGGLMSYGSSLSDQFRQVGIYTGRILKGEKPADLPIMRATKFELVINLQTAKTLGIEFPPMLLARADEVIE